jgi:hypothetical protein
LVWHIQTFDWPRDSLALSEPGFLFSLSKICQGHCLSSCISPYPSNFNPPLHIPQLNNPSQSRSLVSTLSAGVLS